MTGGGNGRRSYQMYVMAVGRQSVEKISRL